MSPVSRIAATALFVAGCAAAQPHPFVVGEPVPDLVLPSAADGKPASLADFRGEKLVLHVFASW